MLFFSALSCGDTFAVWPGHRWIVRNEENNEENDEDHFASRRGKTYGPRPLVFRHVCVYFPRAGVSHALRQRSPCTANRLPALSAALACLFLKGCDSLSPRGRKAEKGCQGAEKGGIPLRISSSKR